MRIHNVWTPLEACSTFVWCLSKSQGPPCGQRREMRPSWCRQGSHWCCSADPLQGCPLLSSSGWITVSYWHEHTSAGLMRGLQIFTIQPPWMNDYCFYLMSTCFSLCHVDFQKLPLDKRVSQALNGDLYFSNVLPEDSRPDYICYARFPHTQTIQQKQPISVTVLNSKFRLWSELQTNFPVLNCLTTEIFPTFCIAPDSTCAACAKMFGLRFIFVLLFLYSASPNCHNHASVASRPLRFFLATQSYSSVMMHYHRLMHWLMRWRQNIVK